MSIKENKKNAIGFYKMAYNGNPKKAVELFVGSKYIQHNPLVGDGIEPLIEYFERMKREYPNKSIEFVRVVAEGNLVAICLTLQASHTDDFLGIPATGKQVSFPVNIIYRFEGSKVKEAWFDWDSLFDLMQQLGMELKPKEAEK